MKSAITARALALLAVVILSAAVETKESQTPLPKVSTFAPQLQEASGAVSSASAMRKIPCKTPQNSPMCYWTRGRLTYGNGSPPLRIWKIGTHRMLGVFNGPSHFPPATASDEEAELPNNLTKAYEVEGRRMKRLTGKDPVWPPIVFADLEICPLRPAKGGSMQPVCIESVTKVFVKPNE